MGEWSEVARRAHRAPARDHREHAGVEKLKQGLDDFVAHTGISACERSDLQQQRQAHDDIVERRSRSCGMRQHQRALQLGDAGSIDARAREEAEACVDAIHDATFGDDARDGAGGCIDPRPRIAVEGKGDGPCPEIAQQLEGHVPWREMN